MKRPAILLTAFGLAFAACSGNGAGTSGESAKSESPQPPAPAPEPPPASGGDGDAVDLALPMGLLGELDAMLADGRLDQKPGGFALPAEPLTDHLAIVRDLLASPERIAANLSAITGEITRLLQASLDATGLTGSRPKIPRGVPTVLALKSPTPPTAANRIPVALRLLSQPAAEYPFTLEVLTKDRSEGILVRETLIEFQTGGDTSAKAARMRLTHRQPADGDDDGIDFVVLTYDQGAASLALAGGRSPPVAAVPSGFSFRVVRDAVGGIALAGAYAWSAQGALPPGIRPRYAARRDGDVEAFRLRRSPLDGPSVQELAYVFAPPETNVKTLFEDFGYARLTRDFVCSLVRTPGINAACNVTGKLLRDSIFGAGQAVPAVVATLPDNVCANQSALADAAVWSAIDATCRTISDVRIKDVTVAQSDGSTVVKDLSVCEQWGAAKLLENPQAFNPNGGGKTLVQPPETPGPAHQTLLQALRNDLPADPANVRDVPAPEVVRLPEAAVMAGALAQ